MGSVTRVVTAYVRPNISRPQTAPLALLATQIIPIAYVSLISLLPPRYFYLASISANDLCVDDSCKVDNGGCDNLTSCTDAGIGGVVCGSCPSGYSGSGNTVCLGISPLSPPLPPLLSFSPLHSFSLLYSYCCCRYR